MGCANSKTAAPAATPSAVLGSAHSASLSKAPTLTEALESAQTPRIAAGGVVHTVIVSLVQVCVCGARPRPSRVPASRAFAPA